MVDEVDDVARDDAVLQWMLAAYRAMVPVKDVVAHMKQHLAGDDDARWSSLDMQETILATVVRDAVCDHFPPHKSYVYRFLKSYMDEIEAVGAEAHDELVKELLEFVLHARLGQTTLSSEDLHHVSYAIPAVPSNAASVSTSKDEPLVVTCRVASVFNEVGLKIWEAGWYLAEYIITHPHVFTDQTVLELGAGVGFTGLVLAGVASPKRVLLSDYGSSVMQNLRYNAEINAPHFQCSVDVVTLDWDTWDPSDGAQDSGDAALRPDILLAGDCVYDVTSFPSLVRVLQAFLGQSSLSTETARTRERKAIFAVTIRNQKTFQAFLDQLAVFEIAYEDITTEALATMGKQMFPYSNRHEIRLCELTRAG